MYDSVTKHNFDSVSDAVDRVSDAVDSNLDKVNTNNIEPTYDNASDTNTDSTKYDQNTKGAHKDIDIKGNVQNDRLTYIHRQIHCIITTRITKSILEFT